MVANAGNEASISDYIQDVGLEGYIDTLKDVGNY